MQLERIEHIVYSRINPNPMANRRAQYIEIASVESVSDSIGHSIYSGVAVLRYAATRCINWNAGGRGNGCVADLRRYRSGNICV